MILASHQDIQTMCPILTCSQGLHSGQGQPILSPLVFWTFPKPFCYIQIVSNKVFLDLPYLPSEANLT